MAQVAGTLMALDLAQKMAPAALGGLGGAVGGIFGKKGGKAGKAVGKAIGGSFHKLFHMHRGGRVRQRGTHYETGGKVRMPPRAMRIGGLVDKMRHPCRACKAKNQNIVSGIRGRKF